MITANDVKLLAKDTLASRAVALTAEDIAQLVEWLQEKDDDLRYKAFLLLQHRSQTQRDVFAHWEVFIKKFSHPNSYQRSLGLMLAAENARWADDACLEAVIDGYLALCDDEKPVTVRQCIQGLSKIAAARPILHPKIVNKLVGIDLMARKETQRKLLLVDILEVLLLIRQEQTSEKIEKYIQSARTGGILDEKTKRQVFGV